MDVTPRYLTDFYTDRMDFEGAALVKRYLGKWMRLSGPLRNVSDHDDIPGHRWLGVFMQWPPGNPSVSMFFNNPRWFDRLLVLKRGDPISVLGRIQKIDRDSMVLEDCELVEPEP